MVYCGKPSKGCGECRSRKIRCDQARPACSQCTKANRACSGYRDQLSLMFRDESQQVVRKAKTNASARRTAKVSKRASTASSASAAAARAVTPSEQSESGEKTLGSKDGDATAVAAAGEEYSVALQQMTPPSTTEEDSNSASDLASSFGSSPDRGTVSPVLLTNRQPINQRPTYYPTQDEAVSYFLRYNAWPGAFWMLNTTPDIFVQDNGSSSLQAMKAGVISVGTAMLARIRRSATLKLAAEEEYGNALRHMNSAVSDVREAKANPTLAAVLLLAMFEAITSRAPRNIENWINHIQGAAALLELRGVQQLQDGDGLRLFVQLRYQIIVSCLQRAYRVPQSVLDCSRLAMFLRPQTEAYGDRLVSITGKLSNLRADINTKDLDGRQILATAYAIEAELIAWLAGLPPNFMYTTIKNPTIDAEFLRRSRGIIPYGNQYHLYRELWLAHTWNQYRCSRIIVTHIIMTCLRRLSTNSAGAYSSEDFDMHCSRLRATARQLAIDICASVPDHLGLVGEPSTSHRSHIGGIVLLWPLFLAGATENRSHALRKWAISCFRLIGYTMGIDQALALIELMGLEPGFFEDIDRKDIVYRVRDLENVGEDQASQEAVFT